MITPRRNLVMPLRYKCRPLAGKVAVPGWPGWYAAGMYLGPGPALGDIVLNCALIDLGKATNWAREAVDQAADQAGPGPDSLGALRVGSD
jgi:hypothetical protein